MTRRRNSSQQQQHNQRRSNHHHHHRQQQPIAQLIKISMDNQSSKIQFSITSDGPVDTTVVVEPSVFGANPSTVSSPSSPSPSPRPTFSSSSGNSPVNSTVPDLPPPPWTVIRNMPSNSNIVKKDSFEHFP